jgi:hypothetical protein
MAIASLIALFALVGAACGGDDNGDDDAATPAAQVTSAGDDGADEPDEPDEPADGGSSGTGSGTLTVDGKTFDVTVIFCGLTTEETRNDNVPFSLRGNGSDDMGSFTVDGSIVELSQFNSVTHDLELWYGADTGDPAYRAGVPLAGGGAEPEWVIDGKQVSLEGSFFDADGADVGIGMFEATCP